MLTGSLSAGRAVREDSAFSKGMKKIAVALLACLLFGCVSTKPIPKATSVTSMAQARAPLPPAWKKKHHPTPTPTPTPRPTPTPTPTPRPTPTPTPTPSPTPSPTPTPTPTPSPTATATPTATPTPTPVPTPHGLAWSPPTSGPPPTGYKLHIGTVSGVYTTSFDAGLVTQVAYSDLGVDSSEHFFVVNAYNGFGEGLPSNEIHFP